MTEKNANINEEVNAETEEKEEAVNEAEVLEEPSEIEKLIAENKELNDRLLRNLAEFDNYKKRTAKEKEDMMSFSKAVCLKEFLAVVDNFERALNCESKDADYKKGVEMIFNQLSDVMKKLGVSEIEALNKPFDPEYHNAVSQVESEDLGENVVAEVFQKGYMLNDKVLRHAMVVVANP